MNQRAAWRGLVALVGDAVQGGSRAIERIQKETARRPFAVLEAITPIAGVAATVHRVYDLCTTVTHGTIRGVTRVVVASVDAALAPTDDTHPRLP